MLAQSPAVVRGPVARARARGGRSFGLAAVLVSGAFLLVPGPAAGAAPPPGGFGLSLSPTRLSVDATPGVHSQSLTVTDDGSEMRHVVVNTGTFRADASGSIVVTGGSSDPSSRWLSASPRVFDLQPGQSQVITTTVTVPVGAEPGERQVSLLVSSPTNARQGNLTVNASIGVEFFVNVPGPVVERYGIGPLEAPRFTDGGSMPVSVVLTNAGTVHRDYIAPRNLTMTVDGKPAIDLASVTVLKGSTRKIAGQWASPPLFCLCTLRVQTDDGQGHAISASARVLIFPWRLVVGLILAAIGLRVLVGRLRRSPPPRVADGHLA